MQLNNLVIIPIPYPIKTILTLADSIPLSPTKGLAKSGMLKDDITWKKSLSAFKKFKGKKDKDSKSNKNSHSNIPFLEEEQPNQILNTNFSIVQNDIKFSLLITEDYEQIKFEDTFDYFDPNKAPFFQFGVTYQFFLQDRKISANENDQEPLKLTKRSSLTLKLKKEHCKKQKSKSQNPEQDLILKTQKSHSSQNLHLNETRQASDPFIIVKAPEIRQKQSSQSHSRGEPKKFEETKRTKLIKKRLKYASLPSRIYSRDLYCRPRCQDSDSPENEQSNEKSLGCGNDELPIIEFDFGMPDKALREIQNENGTDNLPIYEIKDTSVVRSRIRPFINSSEILQEYEFNPEFISEKGIVQPKEEIEFENEQGLEKA